ncbi:MAG: SAM-dependent methyltransferase, partial [Gammaproteobacteria bacterium WSBS_2016_MAG_OTU1]
MNTGAIHALILQSGGWVPFARYLELALHHEQVGFYGSGRVKFGAGGDFITAPCLSPLFGRVLARQSAQIINACGGDILELGAGDGHLAATIIESMPAQCRYFILETSAALRVRQKEKLSDKVQWLDELPDSFNGVIIANEVLDAIPFSLFIKRGGEWQLRGVQAESDGALIFRDTIAPDDFMRQRLQEMELSDNYQTEISPAAEALTRTLCQILQRGAVIIADYGFGRA